MKKLKRLLTLATITMAVEHQMQQKIQEKQRRKKTQRRWWTREWILRREHQLRGSVHLAHRELLYEYIVFSFILQAESTFI